MTALFGVARRCVRFALVIKGTNCYFQRMSEQVCDPPIHAIVESFSMADMVGTLALADGRKVKFGGSALHDFEQPPAVRSTVFVHALQEHPRLGLRAKVIKKSATTEAERLAEEQQAAAAEEARQQAHEQAWREFRGQFTTAPIAKDWAPGIDYECPPLATIQRLIDEMNLEKMNDGLERIMGLLDQTTPGEFIPSLEGESLPWNPFWDPMSWPIADDGGGNLICIHLAPYFYAKAPAPVTFWFHELSRAWFLADDLETFLRETQALADAGDESTDSPFLQKMSAAEKAGWDDVGGWSWLWPTGFGEKPANMSRDLYFERGLIFDISEALNDEPQVGEEEAQMATYRAAFDKLLEVEHIYEAKGWTAPLNHLRFQRRRIFS